MKMSPQDIAQINSLGISEQEVLSQWDLLKKGCPPIKLVRPCTLGDGIKKINPSQIDKWIALYEKAALSGRAMKFVPASGAASRMFSALISYDARLVSENCEKSVGNEEESINLIRFFQNLSRFAFYQELKSILHRNDLDIDSLVKQEKHKTLLEYLLSEKRLNYSKLPKGLIPFHCYQTRVRTAFEEQLVETAEYTLDERGFASIHFTVSPQHETQIKKFIEKIKGSYENTALQFKITISTQKSSTDTLAVDLLDQPVRDTEGKLVFRPSGHGALLHNLQAIGGDIVFIKNIDNVARDSVKNELSKFKKVLGGYLVAVQERVFSYLKQLEQSDIKEELLDQVFHFAWEELSISPIKIFSQMTIKEKQNFLFQKLNRPIRICGMVPNQGEAGGGPFWVEDKDHSYSLQIVEQSQIDLNSSEQKKVFQSSTHFNPVDLVCGLKDFTGNVFDLGLYVDPDRGFISIKSKDGKEIKTLERPGLWNGSMAFWNTIFVEVPAATFSPVKTVLDLLRLQHQE